MNLLLHDLLANVAIDTQNVGKLSLVVDNARQRQKERTPTKSKIGAMETKINSYILKY